MQKVIDGQLVNYEVMGEGRKNLLILHGWRGHIENWRQVAEKLGERYKVILVDLPGFGGSHKPSDDWGVYEYAKFTEKFLAVVGIKKCVVLGHSFGGRIGILLAARTNLVEKLILVDAAGMEIKSFKVRLMGFLGRFLKFLPRRVKNKLGSKDYKEAGEMRKIFVKTVNQPLRDELSKIKTQTLIVWGDKDKVLSLREAKMLHEGIHGSVLRIVWGASHWPQEEKFGDFMRILEEEGV